MLHAGLDLSRKRLDVCLVDEQGSTVLETAAAPDADGLRGLVERLEPLGPVRAAIESMNGARVVHDRLEGLGWEVEIADAQKARGWPGLPARPTASMPGSWPSSRAGARADALAARARRARRARASAVSAAPRAPLHGAQETCPLDADGLRPAVPGVRPLRGRRPRTARAPRRA